MARKPPPESARPVLDMNRIMLRSRRPDEADPAALDYISRVPGPIAVIQPDRLPRTPTGILVRRTEQRHDKKHRAGRLPARGVVAAVGQVVPAVAGTRIGRGEGPGTRPNGADVIKYIGSKRLLVPAIVEIIGGLRRVEHRARSVFRHRPGRPCPQGGGVSRGGQRPQRLRRAPSRALLRRRPTAKELLTDAERLGRRVQLR